MSWIIRSNLIEGRQVVVKREGPIWVIRVDLGMSGVMSGFEVPGNLGNAIVRFCRLKASVWT